MSEENRQYQLSQIRSSRLGEHRQLAVRVFDACETTRDENDYCPPPLAEPGFPFRKNVTFKFALAKFLRQKEEVRLLDLGCGAGFWLEGQAKNPQIEAYGISARDYRHPENRPPVTFLKTEFGQKGRPIPIYRAADNPNILYSGYDLDRRGQLDDQHYLIDDVHHALPHLPENYFHLIISHQACRYFFDPLRVLKQINRVLLPGGYAFLESFSPKIVDHNEVELSSEQTQEVFRQAGLVCSFGTYHPDPRYDKQGLSLKKTSSKLSLPVRYHDIAPNPSFANHTLTVVYQLT